MAISKRSISRRGLAAAGSIAVAALVLSGCAGGDPGAESEESITMVVSAGSSGDTFIALAERFSAETGIRVNVEAIPNSDVRQQQILELSTGSSDLDVITVNDAWIASLHSNLEDLGALAADENWDDGHLIPAMRELFSFEGTQIALPSRVGGRVLVYREDLLAEAGFSAPPETWDEFVEIARAITDPSQNRYGAGFTFGQTAHLVDAWGGVLISQGGEFVNGEQLAIGSDASIRSAQLLADLYSEGLVPQDSIEYADSELISALQQGRVAMSIIYSPWLSRIADPELSPHSEHFRIAPRLPGVAAGGGSSWINGWGFGINQASNNKAAAWEFVKYATDPEVQAFLAIEHNNDPVASSVYDNPEYLAAKPEAPNVMTTIADAGRLPAVDGWSDVYLALESIISSIVVGAAVASDAMPNAERDLQNLVNR